jgi:hypothetical protein
VKADASDCCQQAKTDSPKQDCGSCCLSCLTVAPPQQPVTAETQPINPDRQIVFVVQGLTCPAVKGIGCGQMLAPVLERLDKIDGVGASLANYTGTMIRIAVADVSNREKVADRVSKELASGQPARLKGDELVTALRKEEWRELKRIGELSAIEYRTLAVDWLKAFSNAEKLDRGVTDKLLNAADEEWDRLAKAAEAKKVPLHKTDWRERCGQLATAVTGRAKELLTPEQFERMRKAMAERLGGSRP